MVALSTTTEKLSIFNMIVPWPVTLPEPVAGFEDEDLLHFLNMFAGDADVADAPGALAPAFAFWFIKT